MRINVVRIYLMIMVLMVFGLAGCAGTTELTPAPAARPVPGFEQAASEQVDGIEVVVQSGAWPGSEVVVQEVVPLKVTIENTGDSPVRIEYQEFALITPEGERFAALPPFRVQEEAARRPPRPMHPPVGFFHHGFHHHGFSVAGHLHYFYPSIRPFRHSFAYDPFYYDRYYSHWLRNEITMEQIQAHAIPAGVLGPGGRISGFFYFEEVNPDEVNHVNFHGDIINARTDKVLGTMNIPFLVSER